MPGALDEKDHHVLKHYSGGERHGGNHISMLPKHATLSQGI